MRVEELRWTPRAGWLRRRGSCGGRADLVLYFGDRETLRCADRFAELRAAYPEARIVGGSATANVLGAAMDERSIAAVAVSFAGTRVALAQRGDVGGVESRACGEAIGRALAAPDLAGVFVLADGLRVNGSGLTAGLNDALGSACPILGGMTSDPCQYTEALAGADAPPASGVVAALGFYGRSIRLSYGTCCGWDAFGPRRRISRASGNVLFDLDNKPAMALYELYLGEQMNDGTGACVIFPLLISPPDQPERAFVRAVIGIDQASGAMTFAGDIPQGWMARLMRGNLDRLALGAADAARQARAGLPDATPGDTLALMVSCTGRFLLMGQRTVEEIDFATNELGRDMRCLGFYSYGEIAPTAGPGAAALHNQSVTIIGLAEVEA
jgi:hypothetical protein